MSLAITYSFSELSSIPQTTICTFANSRVQYKSKNNLNIFMLVYPRNFSQTGVITIKITKLQIEYKKPNKAKQLIGVRESMTNITNARKI